MPSASCTTAHHRSAEAFRDPFPPIRDPRSQAPHRPTPRPPQRAPPALPERPHARRLTPARRAARQHQQERPHRLNGADPGHHLGLRAHPHPPRRAWPAPTLNKIVTSFSKPDDRVVLLPWPSPAPRPRHASMQTAKLAGHAPAAPDDHLGAAVAVIADLDRTAQMLHLQLDPTGTVVACAQNADLLYLQHIIALHTPIHRVHLLPHSHHAPAPPPDHAPQPSPPTPHHRISSDVLVFAQPHDHQPPLPPSTALSATATRR